MYHDPFGGSHSDELARQISEATAAQRLELQPKLGRMIEDMQKAGLSVPVRLRNLHEQLLDEVIEARFDNLPI